MSCGCMGHLKKDNTAHEESKRDAVSDEKSDPLKILNLRYARGELKRDEYMKMRDDIIAGD